MCAWEGKHTYKYTCMIIIKHPLSPCSVSMSDCYSPPVGGWLQRDVGAQVLLMQGCQVVCGLEIAVCPAGVAQAGVALSL